MNPNLFNEGEWDTHVHWARTGTRRNYWQCRLVRSRVNGRLKGAAHMSDARGYLQANLYGSWRYRFVLRASVGETRHWGTLVHPWRHIEREKEDLVLVVGNQFAAFIAAMQLRGEWGNKPQSEWVAPHDLKPCPFCPTPILFRLKLRGVLVPPVMQLPTYWPYVVREVPNAFKAPKVSRRGKLRGLQLGLPW